MLNVLAARIGFIWRGTYSGQVLRLLLALAALTVARLASAEIQNLQSVGSTSGLGDETVFMFGQRLLLLRAIITFLCIALAGLLLPIPVQTFDWLTLHAPTRQFPAFRILWLGPFVAFAGAFIFLLVQLWLMRYIWYYAWIEVLFVIALLSATFLYDRNVRVRLGIDIDRWDLLTVTIVAAGFGVVVIQDLTNYYYSFHGDEYVFLWAAQDVAEGKIANPFWQFGVYEVHPVLGTMLQAGVMKIFGMGGFAWKLSSVLIIVASFPLFYGFVKQAFSRTAAVAGLVLTACAHVILAYGHTGQNNIQPILLAAMAVAFYLLGFSRRSVFYTTLAGLACGLGFYTFFTGRILIFLLLAHLLVATIVNRQMIWPVLAPLLAGFFALFLPFAAFNKEQMVTRMLDHSVIAHPNALQIAGPLEFVLSVIGSTASGFFYFVVDPGKKLLFMSGSLLDLTTGVLALAGTILLARAIKQPASLLAFFWLAGSLVIAQGFSPTQEVAFSRVQFAIPPAALAAGVALERIASMIGRLRFVQFRHAIAIGAIVGVIALAGWGNYSRFYVDTPKIVGARDRALVLRAVTEPICESSGLIAPTVVDSNRTTFSAILAETYHLGDRQPWILGYDEVDPKSVMRHRSCLVVMVPESEAARQLVDEVMKSQSGLGLLELVDPSGKFRVEVIWNPDPVALASGSTLARLSPKYPRVVWSADGGGGDLEKFTRPLSLDTGPDGRIYVADRDARRIRVLDRDGGSTGRSINGLDNASEPFVPSDVAIDADGRVMILDVAGRRILVFDQQGSLLRTINGEPKGFNRPLGMDVDLSGNLYVADVGSAQVLKFDPSGKFSGEFDPPARTEGAGPTDVAVGADGQMYITSMSGHAFAVLSPAGEVQAQWSTTGQETDIGAHIVKIGDAVLVASPERQLIRVFDDSGRPIGQYRRLHDRSFNRPIGLTRCGDEIICLADFGDGAVLALDLYQRDRRGTDGPSRRGPATADVNRLSTASAVARPAATSTTTTVVRTVLPTPGRGREPALPTRLDPEYEDLNADLNAELLPQDAEGVTGLLKFGQEQSSDAARVNAYQSAWELTRFYYCRESKPPAVRDLMDGIEAIAKRYDQYIPELFDANRQC